MAFFKVNRGSMTLATLISEPLLTFSSSSAGVTGSVRLMLRQSRRERATRAESYAESAVDSTPEQALLALSRVKAAGASDLTGAVTSYVAAAHGAQSFQELTAQVRRRTPSLEWSQDTGLKHTVKVLGHSAKSWNADASLSYTNYHSFNFFTSSTVSTSSVLLYPSPDRANGSLVRGELVPTGAFSIDFRVNPRYAPDRDSHFRAATLLHLSSCFAVSLVSGSGRDQDGRVSDFRVMLQLSRSADVEPSRVSLTSLPSWTFLTPDGAIKRNAWHRVTIRCGDASHGLTGSMSVNQAESTPLSFPNASVAPASSASPPYALCVGNFYAGSNAASASLALFFSEDAAARDGLKNLIADGGGTDEPISASFSHPMCGEVHDILYVQRWLTDAELRASDVHGFSAPPESCVLFLPPLFTEESPEFTSVGAHGGVILTPFQERDGHTTAPVNAELMLGVNGHAINLQNFVMDHATRRWPRMHHLTASVISQTSAVKTADEFLDTSELRFANLLIMPCDDGSFVPSFKLLSQLSQSMFTDDLRHSSDSQIRLTDLISTSSLAIEQSGSSDAASAAIGPTPENPSVTPGPALRSYAAGSSEIPALSLYQRLRDGDSQRLTFFEFSSALKGSRIKPGSLWLRDSAISGSGDAFAVTLRDNGRGSLYRCDSSGSHATWASCGHVFYDEGIAVIKSPHLWRFGQRQFSASWRATRYTPVVRFDALAPAQAVNSSSHAAYCEYAASDAPGEPQESSVVVSGVTWLDSRFNVIMKTRLAQPVLKRAGSSIVFRHKIDF